MQPIIYIRSYEYLLLPLYLIVLYLLLRALGTKHYKHTLQYPYLYLGFSAKMLFSIAFALMSQFYFKEGDTFMYFSSGLDFKTAFFNNFPDNFHLLTMPSDEFGKYYEQNFDNTANFGYINSSSILFFAKISGFLSILAFNGYLLTSVLMGALAFSGMWRLFVLFSNKYPHLIKQIAVCFLFLPSILYWGGGIMRDTICLAGVGWLFSSFYYCFISRTGNWKEVLILLGSFYLLFEVKAYIVIILALVFSLWMLVILFKKIKSSVIRKIILYSITGSLALAWIVFYYEVTEFLNNQLFANMVNIVLEAKKNYEVVNTGTEMAITNFTDLRPNFTSIFSNIPIAINNALYRPYIWESTKLNILLSSIENTLLILLTLITVFARGPLEIFKKLFSNQLLAASFTFSILFAIMIGFSCFNLGSMVRYKIPCLPFYCVSLVLLYFPWNPNYKEK